MNETLNTTLAEPLIEACSEGRFKDVEALLQSGADPNAGVEEMGRHGVRTVRPLTATFRVLARGDAMPKVASRQAERIMLALIAAGARVRIVEREMLVYAVRMGLPETLNFLVEQGARVHRFGHELMECAMLFRRLDCVEALARLGIDPNVRDQWGSSTFLDICSGNLRLESTQLRGVEAATELAIRFQELFARGVDINVTDRLGSTPLMRAIVNHQDAAMMALLECGAEVDRALRNGVTAVHLAAASGSQDRLRRILAASEESREHIERLSVKRLQPDVKAFLAAFLMEPWATGRTQAA